MLKIVTVAVFAAVVAWLASDFLFGEVIPAAVGGAVGAAVGGQILLSKRRRGV